MVAWSSNSRLLGTLVRNYKQQEKTEKGYENKKGSKFFAAFLLIIVEVVLLSA